MTEKYPKTQTNCIESFLKKNPDLRDKLNSSITFATSMINKLDPNKKKLDNDKLVDELWILKIEERTRLNVQVNLHKQIIKLSANAIDNKDALDLLNKQLLDITEQLDGIRQLIYSLKQSIKPQLVPRDMRSLLNELDKHIKNDKDELKNMNIEV